MTSPAARLYAALHEVACDNDSARMRAGLAHGDYTSAATLALEDGRIFQRSWICLGHEADISEPGDYAVEAILDHAVLLIRGDDGSVRAFHNVCRHRGHAVASGCGNARWLTCPYHAWTYASDGSLFYAPHTADVAGFDQATLGLRPVRLEIVAGALFVSLDADSPPFEDCYPGLRAEIEAWAPSPEAMELVYQSPARHDANWKASVENFSECYHCRPVHKFLTDNIIDPDDADRVNTAYTLAMAEEVRRLCQAIPHDDLTIQWDACWETVVFNDLFDWAPAGDPMARIALQTPAISMEIPDGVVVGYHFCYGSMHDEHFVEPADLARCVALANFVVGNSGRRIDFVHMPVPIDRDDDAYFAPLRGLRIGGCHVYLGLVHHEDGGAGAKRRMAAARRHLPHFGIAAECGMGRMHPDLVVPLLQAHADAL